MNTAAPLVLTPSEPEPFPVEEENSDGPATRQKVQAARQLDKWNSDLEHHLEERGNAVSGRQLLNGEDLTRAVEWCPEAAAFIRASLPVLAHHTAAVWISILRYLGFIGAAHLQGKCLAASRGDLVELCWWSEKTGDNVMAELFKSGMTGKRPNYRDNATGPRRSQLGNLHNTHPTLWLAGALALQRKHGPKVREIPAPTEQDVAEWEAIAASVPTLDLGSIASHPLKCSSRPPAKPRGAALERASSRERAWLATAAASRFEEVGPAGPPSSRPVGAVMSIAKSNRPAVPAEPLGVAAPSPAARATTDGKDAGFEEVSSGGSLMPAELRAFGQALKSEARTDARDTTRRRVADAQESSIRASVELLTGYKPPRGTVPPGLCGEALPHDAAELWLATDGNLRAAVGVLDFLVAARAWVPPPTKKPRSEKFADACAAATEGK